MKTSKAARHAHAEIVSELHGLVAEAEGLAGNAADASEEAIASLRDRYEDAQARLSDMYGRAKRSASDAAAYADDTIRENPYTTLAIVAGISLLIGVLVTSRRNSR